METEKMLRLFIKTVDNVTFPVNVEKDSSVEKLKFDISKVIDVPEDRQRLIFRGRVLENHTILREAQIEDEQVIHLVVRPVIPVTRNDEGATGSNSSESSTPTPPSLEHVRQGLLSVRTILSSVQSEASVIPRVNPDIKPEKQFFVGQWLDVKDTVAQWLEATVMDINHSNNTVFIHYNGWPNRWDEWISCDSPRISLFRSRTREAEPGHTACPTPNSSVPDAPITGVDDMRVLMPEFAALLSQLEPIVSKTAHLCVSSLNPQPAATDDTGSQSLEHHSTLAALLDRMGRVLVDLAPHVDGLSKQLVQQSSSGSHSMSAHLRSEDDSSDGFLAPITRSRGLFGQNDQFVGGGQLNIHVAIVSSPPRDVADSALSQAVSNLQLQSAALARQQQRLEALRVQQLQLQRQQMLLHLSRSGRRGATDISEVNDDIDPDIDLAPDDSDIYGLGDGQEGGVVAAAATEAVSAGVGGGGGDSGGADGGSAALDDNRAVDQNVESDSRREQQPQRRRSLFQRLQTSLLGGSRTWGANS